MEKERIKRGQLLKSPVDKRIYYRIHPMMNSVERYARNNRGEVNEVRVTPGWRESGYKLMRVP